MSEPNPLVLEDMDKREINPLDTPETQTRLPHSAVQASPRTK